MDKLDKGMSGRCGSTSIPALNTPQWNPKDLQGLIQESVVATVNTAVEAAVAKATEPLQKKT